MKPIVRTIPKMKKKKDHSKSLPSHTPIRPIESQAVHAPIQWNNTVLIADSVYYGIVSWFGIGCTVLFLVALSAYFIKAMSVRPRILDRQIVTRFIDPPTGQPATIYRMGPENSIAPARSQDGRTGLHFTFGENRSSGMILSRELIRIPDDAKNFAVTLNCAYKGHPTFYLGFTNRVPTGNVDSFEEILAGETMVMLELPPSLDQMRFFLSMASTYYTPDLFEVPWTEARYFYFFITSPIPTEFFLNDMILVEKR